jgi:hypothetical protein
MCDKDSIKSEHKLFEENQRFQMNLTKNQRIHIFCYVCMQRIISNEIITNLC